MNDNIDDNRDILLKIFRFLSAKGGEIMVNNHVLCIDLKSFYASVECVDRGLNPMAIPLVVADKSHGNGSIVLAVSPYLRKKGIPSRLRIYELPNQDDIVFARPRMSRYLQVSAQIINLILDFVSQDDLHVYSIDECFIDVTHYLKYFDCTVDDLASRIQNRIYTETGLTSTIGIGPNMLIAKIAMDVESKHTLSNIAHWTYDDIPTKLWKIAPLSKMWGIGHRLEKKLNGLGMYCVGDIAKYPKNFLSEKLGIIGEQLHNHSHGIDNSNIREKYIPQDESLTSGQVFMRDYKKNEIPLIIRETLDDLLLRLACKKKLCKSVSLGIGYSKPEHGGFYHQLRFDNYTDSYQIILNALMRIFNKHIKNYPIRKLSIVLGNIKKKDYYQLDIFSNPKQDLKKRKLFFALASIKDKYGNNAILRTSAKLNHSNIEHRHNLIGGHHK